MIPLLIAVCMLVVAIAVFCGEIKTPKDMLHMFEIYMILATINIPLILGVFAFANLTHKLRNKR